jgi:hypothetical protein
MKALELENPPPEPRWLHWTDQIPSQWWTYHFSTHPDAVRTMAVASLLGILAARDAADSATARQGLLTGPAGPPFNLRKK